MKTLTKLLFFLLLLNLLDALTTFVGLSLGASETNTLWGPVGPTNFLAKIFFVSLLCGVLYAANFFAIKEHAEAARKFIFGAAFFLNVLFAVVIINNLYCIFLATR